VQGTFRRDGRRGGNGLVAPDSIGFGIGFPYMGLAIHRMRLKHWRVLPCQTNVSSSLMTSASELRSGKTHRDENFPVASWIIHPRHRALILSFYNFVRTADDIADHATLAADEKLRLLDLLETELLGKGDTQKEAVNLRNALAERAMAPRHALDVLIAFRMDVTKLRYEDWDDVIHYCRYSAMPVGRFMLDVHGESTSTWAASDALCAGLQINNHLQDCGKDYKNLNRVYLPRDALADSGAPVEALGEARASAPLLQCLHSLAARTEMLLNDSRSLSAEVKDFRLGLEVSVIQRFADKIVQLLKVRDPLSETVHLGPTELLAHSVGGIASELTRRAVGRRPLSNPAAGA
jgi:squalene synthase HpnC